MANSVEYLVREALQLEATSRNPVPFDGVEMLRRARRARTRRRIAVPFAAILAVVAISAGAGVVTASVERTPTTPAASATPTVTRQHPAGVVQVKDNKLSTPDGRTFTLPTTGDSRFQQWIRLEPAYDGWLVSSSVKTIWVRSDGRTSVVSQVPPDDLAEALASPDGRKVAVTRHGRGEDNTSTVTVYDLAAGTKVGSTQLTGQRDSEYAMAYRWFGGRVVLAQGDSAPYALWDPASGAYHGKFTGQEGRLAGVAADGKRMVGFTTTNGAFCMGFIDPEKDFAMSDQKCDPARNGRFPFPSLSPDRHRVAFLDIEADAGVWTATVDGDRIVPDRPLPAPKSTADRGLVWDGDGRVLYQLPTFTSVADWAACDLAAGRCRKLNGKIDVLFGAQNPPAGS